ncbi:Ca2-binding protein [Aureococcus anophagefferens]|nr:Ca2-binding protein [Aureococcus anophagefferens]
MVPALVALRAVDGATGKPLQDQAAVEAWLEPADDGDTAVRLPCCAAHGPPARVRPGARYVLKVKAPKRRLASPALVGGVLGGGAHGDELVFEDEHWWDASTKLRTATASGRSSKEPVVLELVAALEPSRSKLRISVVADDAPSALGAGVRVEALVDGLLPGHVQLRPRDAVTLIAGGTQDVVVQLRPASVVARCVDARSHAPLDLGRVRLAPREPSAAGLEHARGRPPVVVDVAAWRPCVVTSHVADGAAPDDPALHAVPARVGGKLVAPVYAYGVTFDDGTRDVVPAAALRGARWGVLDSRADGDGKLDWGVLATRPAEASYAVGDRVEAPRGAAQAYVAGVVASALDGGRYGIDFDGESRTDVVAGAALRPERWTATFRCYLPVGLACEARHATRGLYDVAADLPGYRQVSHLEPVLFEAKKFLRRADTGRVVAVFSAARNPVAVPLDVPLVFVVDAKRHAQKTMVDAVVYTADDFSRGPLDVAVALAPSSCAVDVRVVDAASGADLPLADFVCGDEHFGTRRGVLELAGSDLTAPRRVDALLDGYDDVDASRGRVLPVPGGVAPVVVRLRVFRVRLSAVRSAAAPAALLDARVLERVDGGACAPALSRDGVAEAGVSSASPTASAAPGTASGSGRSATPRVADAADAVRPRRSVLVVLGRSYDLRVVHESMRQRDLLDPQRFERLDFLRAGPLARAPGAPAAALPDPLTLTVHLEPYRCSIDLAVVDAFGDDLPDAQVKLGCYLVGTRRGVVDLDLTDRAVVGA